MNICPDSLSGYFIPSVLHPLLYFQLVWSKFTGRPTEIMNAVLNRNQYGDTILKKCVDEDFQNFIILGAGNDTR